MPYGSRLSEEDLRSIARQLISDGRLPVIFSENLFGGYGSGLPCCLCEQPIERKHVEYEVTDPRNGRAFRFHLVCHAAWELECVQAEQRGHRSKLA